MTSEKKTAESQDENIAPEEEGIEAEPEMQAQPEPHEDDLQNEINDLKDRLLRALAESDNIRKRAEKERADTAKYAVGNFARQLVGVADNLRRALESIPEEARESHEALNSIFVGVAATERELLRAFESAGIKVIEAEGQLFNPNFHEVMFEAEMPDTKPGTIIQVMEPGYMIHDRLLRPARVGVARGGKSENVRNINEEI